MRANGEENFFSLQSFIAAESISVAESPHVPDMKKSGNARIGKDHKEFFFFFLDYGRAQFSVLPGFLPFFLNRIPIDGHGLVIRRVFLKITSISEENNKI